MTVAVWRIAVETSTHAANDLSGAGAKRTGGRWNSPGVAMVYTSTNIALATLETLSYLQYKGVPYNRYLVRIDIPQRLWRKRTAVAPLPGGWDAVPIGLTGRCAGDEWIAGGHSALLQVPSVIVPDESNILINPEHPDAAAIRAVTIKRWAYDPRLL